MRLIDADALIEEIVNIDDLRRLSTASIGRVLKAVPTIDAIPVEYLMKYAQLPTEFAIAAWRKQDKDDQEKQIKRLDKPMSFDDALNLVNEVFPLGQKEQGAR